MRRTLIGLVLGLSGLVLAACGNGGVSPSASFDEFASPSDVLLPSDMLESPSDVLLPSESPVAS